EQFGRRRGRSGARRRNSRSLSPDGKWTAFIKAYNLHVKAEESGEEFALSTDGKADNFYEDRFYWSPDSGKLVAMRKQPEQEHIVSFVETSPKDGLQPKLHSFQYLKPGDRIAISKPQLFDIADRKKIPIDDGLFCNGAESCVGGSCLAGTAVNCGDGVGCTDDSCNEGTDSCDNVANNANCDDGLFCNGSETCSATLDCQAGTAVNCNDGIACTVDRCDDEQADLRQWCLRGAGGRGDRWLAYPVVKGYAMGQTGGPQVLHERCAPFVRDERASWADPHTYLRG
ncbi:MAG: DPP IV N-terminal domain-containing protein, partial [Candidatus Marinimicrobia bacterium]|nr:DPP IV N-terminal domain-containing protein [Candidatus Neomarinimicrobiota bacterium]